MGSDATASRRTVAGERLAIDGGPAVREIPLPLGRPWIGDAEAEAAAAAVRRGELTGDGPIGREVEAALERSLGGHPALLTTSCTAALETSVALCGVVPGDEVICPSFTFVSTANAILRSGTRPVFVEIDPDSLNLAPSAVEAAIGPRTRAIVVVHYGGRACDMAAIGESAARRSIRVIEDAAHGLGATWHGQPLGTVGDFGCFSFHGIKDVVWR